MKLVILIVVFAFFVIPQGQSLPYSKHELRSYDLNSQVPSHPLPSENITTTTTEIPTTTGFPTTTISPLNVTNVIVSLVCGLSIIGIIVMVVIVLKASQIGLHYN
ncbi:hypothetical protein GCK72_022831 [Caenorhabditis remanei]|uniref:Uncharacterized protein n=1 Tax=Caenorhabditis remanei TaxID=31234 RepID=A0A6A5FUW5_CAERE|nr:hypothetical protein GCK72_022831 [Caenorhabditis remanei]KAF1746377.1 hypothetical protein GCK72_022831 [Caenorhabditis remanei]